MRTVFISILSFTVVISACNESPEKKEKKVTEPAPVFNPYEGSDITVEVFKVDSIEQNGSHGWGYDILIDGQIHIHQPNIPAIMGNNGFSSEEKAREAGEFIIQKIRNNVLPPSVTPEELDSLGVLD